MFITKIYFACVFFVVFVYFQADVFEEVTNERKNMTHPVLVIFVITLSGTEHTRKHINTN